MATFTGRKPANTYKDILQVANSNSGIDGTLRTISDGEGTDSAVKISTGALSVDNLTIDGNTVSAGTGGITLTPAAGSAVTLDGATTIDGGVFTTTSLNITANSNQIVLDSDGTFTLTITGSAASSSKTLTLPDVTDTLVAKTTTDTLTNKTLTSPVLNTGVSGTAVLDEDTMSSDSATQLATQQSIKAYVDAEDANIAGDTLTFTNKTFDANGTGNSLSNVDVADLAVGTDGSLISWDTAGNPTTIAPGTSGKFLQSNGAGAVPTYETVTASAGGSDTYVQFNDGGSTIGGDAGFIYNKTTDAATIAGSMTIGGNATAAGYIKLLEDSDNGASGVTITSPAALSGDVTLTLPEVTSTLSALGLAQEYTKTQNFNATTLTSSLAAVAWDLSSNQVAIHTLTENTTLSAPSNQVAGATYLLIVNQEASCGGLTLGFNAAYEFPGGNAPTITATAGATDVLTFVSDGTSMFGVAAQDFS